MHDIGHPDSAHDQGESPYHHQKDSESHKEHGEKFLHLGGVPHHQSLFILWVELKFFAQNLVDFLFYQFRFFRVFGLEYNIIDIFVTVHGGESGGWDEGFICIPTTIAGILRLLLHHSDNQKGDIVNYDVFAYGFIFSKQIFFQLISDEYHSLFVLQVDLVDESPAHLRIYVSHFPKDRIDSHHILGDRILLVFHVGAPSGILRAYPSHLLNLPL